MKKAVSTTFSRRTDALLACSAAVLLAAVGANASAQTPTTSIYHLYVSPTGSDYNTGSSSRFM